MGHSKISIKEACRLAREAEKVGEFERACKYLAPWWTFNSWPKLGSLELPDQAELLFCAGSLTSELSRARRTRPGQRETMEKAKILLHRSVAFYEATNAWGNAAEAALELACCYYCTSEYELGINLCKLAQKNIKLGKQTESQIRLGELNLVHAFRLGMIKRHQGKYYSGYNLMKKAEKYVHPHHTQHLMGRYYGELALLAAEILIIECKNNKKEVTKVKSLYENALRFHQLSGHKLNCAMFINNYGYFLSRIDKFAEAEYYLAKSLESLAMMTSRSYYYACVCDSLAQLHIKMGQLDAALNNISEAIEILSNSEKSDTLAEALIIQGIIFSKLAQWGEARISFVKSLQIAQQTEVWELGGIAMLTLLEEMCERLGTSERNEALSRAEFYLGNTQNSLLRQRLSACVAMVKEADALEQQKLDWQVQQEKMTALGQLAFGVAHDFNNSLAIIKGRASLMTQEKLSEPVAHGLRVIARTVEDAAKMVRRIQDFGRLKPEPMFVPVALSPLLQDIRDLFQLACQEQEVSLEIKANSPAVVLGDTTELREVLVNLMTNSLEATASQGLICLSLECVENKVEVAVKDTGRGMLPEVERRIFEPFFTTKKERGTGMGLAVSYGIVQRHGGEFVVKSKAGEGTTVQVILPLAKEIEDMA